MRVVVPALSADCPAVYALRSMRVSHEVVIIQHNYSYANLMNQLWDCGEDFIIVEHDIVPYPEALEGLINCDKPYCGCYYPLGAKLGGTLGFTKFTKEITREIPIDFTGIKWNVIDAKIAAEFEKYGIEDFHRHFPSVAHLHQYN